MAVEGLDLENLALNAFIRVVIVVIIAIIYVNCAKIAVISSEAFDCLVALD